MVHKKLNEALDKNMREVLAMHQQGVNLLFTDIDRIRKEMERELEGRI